MRDRSTFDLKARAGQENWATIASLIETCKFNAVDPQTYPTATLTAIGNGHKQSRIDEFFAVELSSGLRAPVGAARSPKSSLIPVGYRKVIGKQRAHMQLTNDIAPWMLLCRDLRGIPENEFEKGAPDQGQTPFSC